MMDLSERDSTMSPLLERVELAFAATLADFEVCERGLRYDGRAVADLLARGEGRCFLISLVGRDEDEVALRALDSLAFARTHEALIGDYLGDDASCTATPEVVLVGESFSTNLRTRLATLFDGADFWLAVPHELSTASGSSTQLERLVTVCGEPAVPLPSWAAREPLRAFFEAVPLECLDLALDLVKRLTRVHQSVEWAVDRDRVLVGDFGADLLCELRCTPEHLEVRLDGCDTTHIVCAEEELDEVLDEVQFHLTSELLIRKLETPIEEPELELGAQEPSDDEAEDEQSELRQVELRPAQPAPLLSAEELAAFYD